MGYVSKSFGTKNEWNTEGGVNDTDLSAIILKDTSNATRLDGYMIDGNDRFDVIAYGQFEIDSSMKNVAGLKSAVVTTLLVQMNGRSSETVEYSPGFDLIKWLTSFDYRYSLLNGSDEFFGSLDNPTYGDQVRGGAGNDHFTGYRDGVDANGKINYDSFFGEAGIDTAHYRGKISEYQINLNAKIWDARYQTQTQGISVVDKVSGRDGTDWLKEVERLDFSDANLALDINGNAGAAYRLYKAAFDRAPDLGGLGYWIAQLDKGGKLSDAATYFSISPEFQSLYGSQTSDSQFVNLLYQHVLHRAAEGEGFNFWVNALSPSGGWNRGGVLEFFSQSPENQGQTAELVANGIQYQEWLG